MKNFLVISMIIVAIFYMFVMMKDKYNTIEETNKKIAQQKKIK